MQINLRNTLDASYARLKHIEPSPTAPTAFAGNYALCLGMIMGAQTCKGMSVKEAESERAYLAMLAAFYEIQLAMPRKLSKR
ncbi:hypothetical protein [Burkholderia sp. S171]|uniref:hypothetical protein n=1 Tax=Burkholderia sp. S171 TaxID=1641860 RepID=UPI00131BD2ED|nr:hypothetical protein [Burkholderia sp. S171]